MSNNRGSKIEPCGIPNSISCHKLYELFTHTPCFLFDKQLWINFKVDKVKPYELSFAIRSSFLRQSGALERLVNRAPNILPLSTAFFHFSNNVKRHCCILKPFLKPHQCLENISSKKEDICLNLLFHKFLIECLKCLLAYSFVSHLFFLSHAMVSHLQI